MGGVVFLVLGWGLVLLVVGCAVALRFLLGMLGKPPSVPCQSCGGWDLDPQGKCRKCDWGKSHGFEVITDPSGPDKADPSK